MYADPTDQRDSQQQRLWRISYPKYGTARCMWCRRLVALRKDGFRVRQHKNLQGDWCL